VPGNGDNDVKAGVVKENIELSREYSTCTTVSPGWAEMAEKYKIGWLLESIAPLNELCSRARGKGGKLMPAELTKLVAAAAY
jgi:hypothetical protein